MLKTKTDPLTLFVPVTNSLSHTREPQTGLDTNSTRDPVSLSPAEAREIWAELKAQARDDCFPVLLDYRE